MDETGDLGQVAGVDLGEGGDMGDRACRMGTEGVVVAHDHIRGHRLYRLDRTKPT